MKGKFKNKYEPFQWKMYPNLDCEFIEKIKEKNLEIIFGNLEEKHVFLADLIYSETLFKILNNCLKNYNKIKVLFVFSLKIIHEMIKLKIN